MGKQNYTFEEFQATGKWSDDLTVESPDLLNTGCDYSPRGFYYLGGAAWIEYCTGFGFHHRWFTRIGREEPSSDSLDHVERVLYLWCTSEKIELPDPPVKIDRSEQAVRFLWTICESVLSGDKGVRTYAERGREIVAEHLSGSVQWYCHKKLGAMLPPNITIIDLNSPCGLACKTVIDGACSINANAGDVTALAIKTVCILIDS